MVYVPRVSVVAVVDDQYIAPTTFSLKPLRTFDHMVDIPFRRRLKVLCTIEHNEHRHGFLFHIVEIGQQLGSDQKVLPRVVGWITTIGTARRILDDVW